MARSNAAKDQSPMPVRESGVMLVEYTAPNGVSSRRPPAKGIPSCAVWHTLQSPSAATTAPRGGVGAEGAGADGSDLVAMCYTSADFREGMEAFLAKRPARWTGT